MGRELTGKDILSTKNKLNGKYIHPKFYASGGFGIMYLATDEKLGRDVIIKEFCPNTYLEENIIERIDKNELVLLKSEYQFDFDDMKEKFLGEAQKTAQLSHKNIVKVIEIFDANNTSYIVYEFVENSTTLSSFLERNKLELDVKMTLIMDIIDTLIYTHSKNIIHRDLNPNNILIVVSSGRIEIKIIDFGLAKNIQSGSSTFKAAYPGFSPPEQLITKMSGIHIDIYSLGALLYLLLTNLQPPSIQRQGDESDEKLTLNADKLTAFLYKNLEKLEIEEDLIKIVLKAMKYKYEERYQNATNFKKALEELNKIKVEDEKECPFCAEKIKEKAIVCKYCNKELTNKPVITQLFMPIIQTKIQTKEVKIDVIVPNGMVYVDKGYFFMGSGESSDNPKHRVILSSFFIGKYQVTQKEYKSLMISSPSNFNGQNLPVEKVTWFDAVRYCNEKSKKDGLPVSYNERGFFLDQDGKITNDVTKVKGYRLPTEAEWEFAARGGNKSQGYKYSGSNNPNNVSVYAENSYKKGEHSSDYGTHKVGSLKENELGIFDMSGNVWEWCSDWYEASFYAKLMPTNPYNNVLDANRVIRGGGWYSGAINLAITYRGFSIPSNAYYNIGFRVAKSF
ncbi:MAG: bifunctional serine/threonine-protein kinase/formylglycine-generating enzyme family protein [Cyanobacteriota bacterium]